MSWTPERIAELQKLWQEGLSTAEIGRQLGISKNAVVGKAHRLGLSSRPSPIRRNGKGESPKSKPRLVTLEDLTAGMCRWPFGDPGDEDFHFCGKKAVQGKPYCADHAAKAYVQPGRGNQSNDAA